MLRDVLGRRADSAGAEGCRTKRTDRAADRASPGRAGAGGVGAYATTPGAGHGTTPGAGQAALRHETIAGRFWAGTT